MTRCAGSFIRERMHAPRPPALQPHQLLSTSFTVGICPAYVSEKRRVFIHYSGQWKWTGPSQYPKDYEARQDIRDHKYAYLYERMMVMIIHVYVSLLMHSFRSRIVPKVTEARPQLTTRSVEARHINTKALSEKR